MVDYLTIEKVTQAQLVINKSRFISIAYPVENWEHASKILGELKKTYWDSTHICYGCVADDLGNNMRFSDDGEPQGTAGKPILEVIKQKNLRLILVAVVRYFGGIKLGAGGLVRAYSKAASEVLDQASIITISPKVCFSIKVNYSDLKKIEYLLNSEGIEITDKIWGEDVKVYLKIKQALFQKFVENLKNALNRDLSDIIIKEGI
ncbi:MAG TPA: YigZ family protein [Clostridia bacterium]